MEFKESTNFNSILNELKDTCDGKIKNLELHYVSIDEFNDNTFSEVIDLRSKEEFDFDNIVGSLSIPVLKSEDQSEIVKLPTNHRIRLNTLLRYASSSLSSNFLPHLQNKSADYKPLLVCHDGGVVSEAAAVLARLAKCEANILRGGYSGYRHYVEQHLSLEDSLGRVASYRFLVITGPREGGRAQLIQALKAEANTQVLDLDSMSNEEEAEVTQEMFESRIMHTLIWKFSPDKPVWVVFFKNRANVPNNLSEQLLRSARVHVDTELSSRLQFILEEYDYVVKDERSVNKATEKILAYAGKTEGEEWSSLIEKYV